MMNLPNSVIPLPTHNMINDELAEILTPDQHRLLAWVKFFSVYLEDLQPHAVQGYLALMTDKEAAVWPPIKDNLSSQDDPC